MEITHFGQTRSRITLVYTPPRVTIAPRIIDGTRWILLHPDLLGQLQKRIARGHRAANLSSSTWQAIQRAYLLEAWPTIHHDHLTIYQFGRQHRRITLIYSSGELLAPQRIGSASLITAGPLSHAWLQQFITDSPRDTHAAISYFRDHGLTLSSRIIQEQFSAKGT